MKVVLWLLWVWTVSALPSSTTSLGHDGEETTAAVFSMKKSKKTLNEFLYQPTQKQIPDLLHLNWWGIGASHADSKSIRRQRKLSSASSSGSVWDVGTIGLGRLSEYVNVDKATFCRHLHHPILGLLSQETDRLISLEESTPQQEYNSTMVAHLVYRFAVEGLMICPTAPSNSVLLREVADYIHLPHQLFQALADYWNVVDQDSIGRPNLAFLVEKYDPVDVYVVLRSIFPSNTEYVALFNKRFSDPHQAEILRKKMNDASTPVMPLFRITHALENDDYVGFVMRMQLLRKLMSRSEYKQFLEKAFKPIIFWIFNDLQFGGLFQEDAKILFEGVPFPPGILGLFENFIKDDYCDPFTEFVELLTNQLNKSEFSEEEKEDREFAWMGMTRFFPHCVRAEWFNNEGDSIPEYMMMYFDMYKHIKSENEREQYYRWLLTLLDIAIKDDQTQHYRLVYAFVLKGFVQVVGRDKIMKEIYTFFPLMDVDTLIPRSEDDVLHVDPAQGLQYRINTLNNLKDDYLCQSLKMNEALVNVFPFFSIAMETQNLTLLLDYKQLLFKKSNHGKCVYIRDVVEAIQAVVSVIQQDEFEKESWILRLFYGKTPSCDPFNLRAKSFLQNPGNINAKFLYNFVLYFCRSGQFGETALDFAQEFEFSEEDFRDMRSTLRTLYEMWYLDEKRQQVDDDISLHQHFAFYKTSFTLAFAALGSTKEDQTTITESMFRRYPEWSLLVFRGCKMVYDHPEHPNKALYIKKAQEFLYQNESIQHSEDRVSKYSIDYSYCMDIVLQENKASRLDLAIQLFHRFPSWFCVDVDMMRTVFTEYPEETIGLFSEAIADLLQRNSPKNTVRKLIEAMADLYPPKLVPALQIHELLSNSQPKIESLCRYLEMTFPHAFPSKAPVVFEFDSCWQKNIEPSKVTRQPIRKKKSTSFSQSTVPEPVDIPSAKKEVKQEMEPLQLLIHQDVLQDAQVDSNFLQDVYHKIASECESKLSASPSSFSSGSSSCASHSWEKVRNTPKHLPSIYRIKSYISSVPYRVFFTLNDRTVYILMVAMRNNCYKPLLFSRTLQRANMAFHTC